MSEYKNKSIPVEEKALEPDLPICDAHHHLVNLEGQQYLAADYTRDANNGHKIKQTVIVQFNTHLQAVPGGGMSPVDETRFVMKQIAGLKSKIDVAAGFIGYADLTKGKDVQSVLEAHLEAGGKRFKGIRFYPKNEHENTGPSVLSDPKLREAFALLKKYKLTYELMIEMSQFSELAELAKYFPDIPIIINHLGWQARKVKTPEEKEQLIAGWRRGIQTVAPFENIYMKLGGSASPRNGFGFDKQPKQPTSEEMVKVVGAYYKFLIEQFGPKRCMFESNFPMDKLTSSYNVIWNAFKLMTRSYSNTERSFLFYNTANQVYYL